jgi:hypothetical protein
MMRRQIAGFLMIAGAAAAAGCGSGMIAGADYDRSLVIGQPATFAWGEVDALPVGDPRLDDNPFFEARLHGAIARELAARGIRSVPAGRKPTLLVHYHASVQDHVELFGSEDAPNQSAYGPGTQIVQYEEGNFLVDVVEARTNRVIWRGWARVELMDSLDDPDELGTLLGRAVALMFEFFPIPAGSKSVPDVETPPPRVPRAARGPEGGTP